MSCSQWSRCRMPAMTGALLVALGFLPITPRSCFYFISPPPALPPTFPCAAAKTLDAP